MRNYYCHNEISAEAEMDHNIANYTVLFFNHAQMSQVLIQYRVKRTGDTHSNACIDPLKQLIMKDSQGKGNVNKIRRGSWTWRARRRNDAAKSMRVISKLSDSEAVQR